MYIVKNIFGQFREFDDFELAMEAYEEECRFCEFVGFYDASTGEALAESF